MIAGSDPASRLPRVVHIVDAAGGADQLWGKERVVLWLMEAQARSGDITPQLLTLTDTLLTRRACEAGLPADVLADVVTKDPRPYLAGLRTQLAPFPPAILHTHGYKANLLGRLARWRGVRHLGLVATCHGWVDTTASLRLYNTLDRWTSRYSDAVTVPAPSMLASLSSGALFVPNGIPQGPVPTPAERAEARLRLGLPADAVVAGTLGRLSPEKGIDVLLGAVRATQRDPRLIWVVAGTGPLEGDVRSACESQLNLRFVGYVDGPREFLPALDIFVQPSWSEGLSLALLEAARSACAIVATNVGATEWAVRDRREAFLLPAGEPQRLANDVLTLVDDSNLRSTMAAAARQRFDEALDIEAMHRAYLNIYRDVSARVRTGSSETLRS